MHIILITKNGEFKQTNLATFDESLLYLKAGKIQSNEGFDKRCTFEINQEETICVYGKIAGRKGQENAFTFPFSKSTKLPFYGILVVVCFQDEKPVCLDLAKWKNICSNTDVDLPNKTMNEIVLPTRKRKSSAISSNHKQGMGNGTNYPVVLEVYEEFELEPFV